MIDLFKKVRDNVSNIEFEFSQVKAENPNIEAIAEKIQSESYVSMNRNDRAIVEFLKSNKLQSGYQHLQIEAIKHGCGNNNIDGLYNVLKVKWHGVYLFYIRRRIEFLKTFKQGKDHFFGALNAGGYGAAAQNGAYGEYCIVFKREVFNKLESVAYCKNDTLACEEYWQCDYFTDKKKCHGKECPVKQLPKEDQLKELKCQINLDKLYSHYAPHSHRGRLAAIKHKTDVVGKPDWDIKGIIKERKGKTEDYIEVCFVLPVITLDDVEEIRIHPEILCRIFDEICVDESELGETASIYEFHKEAWSLIEKCQKEGKIYCDFPWKDTDQLENNLNNLEDKGEEQGEQFKKASKNTIEEKNIETYKQVTLDHAKTLELQAIHCSGDAFVKQGDSYYYLIRPPLFKHKHPVNPGDHFRAIEVGEFESPKDSEQYYDDILSLRKHLSRDLPRATPETIKESIDILSKCMSAPSWCERFFSRLESSRDDLANSELPKPLMVGIKRLEALETLSESVRGRLAKRRKKLEEIDKASDEYPNLCTGLCTDKDLAQPEVPTEVIPESYKGLGNIYE